MAEVDLSCATIVSLLPRVLKEVKPGLIPTDYIIPRGTVEKPGLLIIGDDVHYLVNPDQLSDAKDVAYIKVPVKALQAAQSIIQDYVVGLIGVEGEAYPGLFAVRGDYRSVGIVKEKFAEQIENIKIAQFHWFNNLVKMADDVWAKTKSPMGISDLQREAGTSLNLNRDWLSATTEPDKCPFCMTNIISGAIFCALCHHVLDEKKYKALNPKKISDPFHAVQ